MRPGWKDKPNGPSVFAIQVMATKGPLVLWSRFHPGQPRSRMAMRRMGVQTSHPWPLCPKTSSSSCARFLPLFHFPPAPSLHADEMSLNFVLLAYARGERDTRIVGYHIGKFLADREFEISLFISIEWKMVFLIPLFLFIFVFCFGGRI